MEKKSNKSFWEENKYWILPFIVIIPVGAAFYFVQKRFSFSGRRDAGDFDKPGSTTSGFKCTSRSYPLKPGTCHNDVMILQRYLKSKKLDIGISGVNRDGVDGQYGEKTRAAAKKALGKESFTANDIARLKTIK